ncbi:hypothetical protein [Streptomyces griseorubiginosus]|uniref:hypothetical protein n=1 Tax=Streptomyces griseorubiginosus TaxID=67304 RepID=UPI003651F2C9
MDMRAEICDEARPARLEGRVRPSRVAGLPGGGENPLRRLWGCSGGSAEVLS